MGIQDRTVFLSPVGCSVFAYYYFDTGNIQCSHGRAPAVGTGVKRVNEDSIVISYQGDGDLAGIGTTEIIHAANRGENMTVVFINNAIYGMTGGQMAPTTMLGQQTATTPFGRDAEKDGEPIGMAEIINAIKTPVYIERVSLSTPAGIMKTRKAIKKALQNQVDKKGFSFVEVLSPCPINWKMDAVQAREWMKETMEEIFPLGCFRDNSDQCPDRAETKVLEDRELLELFHPKKELPEVERKELKEDQYVKISGFGGQGVLSAGILLANCAIAEGLEVTWLPSYGPEMRGGTANARRHPVAGTGRVPAGGRTERPSGDEISLRSSVSRRRYGPGASSSSTPRWFQRRLSGRISGLFTYRPRRQQKTRGSSRRPI